MTMSSGASAAYYPLYAQLQGGRGHHVQDRGDWSRRPAAHRLTRGRVRRIHHLLSICSAQAAPSSNGELATKALARCSIRFLIFDKERSTQ